MMEAGRTQLLHSDLGAPGSETAGTGAYTWRVSLLYLPFQSRVRQLQANFYVNSPAPPPSQPTPWPFCCLEQIQTLDSEWWMSHSSCVFFQDSTARMSMLLKACATEGEPRGNSASLQGRSPGWDWEISDNWNLKGVSSRKTSWGDGSCNSHLRSLGHLTDRPSCIGEEPTLAHGVLQDLLKSLDLSHLGELQSTSRSCREAHPAFPTWFFSSPLQVDFEPH